MELNPYPLIGDNEILEVGIFIIKEFYIGKTRNALEKMREKKSWMERPKPALFERP